MLDSRAIFSTKMGSASTVAFGPKSGHAKILYRAGFMKQELGPCELTSAQSQYCSFPAGLVPFNQTIIYVDVLDDSVMTPCH